MGCPAFIGQLPRSSNVAYGGTGFIQNGTILITATFENPGGSGYRIRWWSVPQLFEIASYDASAIYGDPDFLEFDEAGRCFAWDRVTGDLSRYVISGGAYIFDATLLTGEPGLHASIYDPTADRYSISFASAPPWQGNPGDPGYDPPGTGARIGYGVLVYEYLNNPGAGYYVDPNTGKRHNYSSGGDRSAQNHLRMTRAPGAGFAPNPFNTPYDANLLGLMTSPWSVSTTTSPPFPVAGAIFVIRLAGSLSYDTSPLGDTFYGMFPLGTDAVGVMVADAASDDIPRPVQRVHIDFAYPGGLGASPMQCEWRKTTTPAGHSFGVLHGGAGLYSGSRSLLRVGFGLGGTDEYDRNIDEGIWVVPHDVGQVHVLDG